MGNRGKREFIQALRLIEVFPETLVAAAALDAIRLGAISFDAVGNVIAKVDTARKRRRRLLPIICGSSMPTFLAK